VRTAAGRTAPRRAPRDGASQHGAAQAGAAVVGAAEGDAAPRVSTVWGKSSTPESLLTFVNEPCRTRFSQKVS
jgi:hypothetical protein